IEADRFAPNIFTWTVQGPPMSPSAGANMNETTTIARTPRAAQAPDTDALFQPYQLGPYNLRHRFVMAPLTRSRARQSGNVPSSLAACYYAQRASAALIVSEATQVSMRPGLRLEARHPQLRTGGGVA